MEFLIIIVHVLAALGITGLVLIQQGKGADMGAAFGAGASQTIFGSVGSGNVLTKSTTWLAVIFFATSLGLAMIARQRADQGIQDSSLIQNVDQLQSIISTGANSAPADADVPAAAGSVDANQAAAQDVPAAAPVEGTAPETNVSESENALEDAPQ